MLSLQTCVFLAYTAIGYRVKLYLTLIKNVIREMSVIKQKSKRLCFNRSYIIIIIIMNIGKTKKY